MSELSVRVVADVLAPCEWMLFEEAGRVTIAVGSLDEAVIADAKRAYLVLLRGRRHVPAA